MPWKESKKEVFQNRLDNNLACFAQKRADIKAWIVMTVMHNFVEKTYGAPNP